MSLLFLDSFDHYDVAVDKYANGTLDLVTGRHGFGNTGTIDCALNPTNTRAIVGGAFKVPSLVLQGLFRIFDVDNNVVTVTVTSGGAIKLSMWGGPTAQTANDIIRASQWHYIEVDVTIVSHVVSGILYDYSLSSARVTVDGNLVLNTTLASSNTNFSVAPTTYSWTHVQLTYDSFGAIVDDLYISDGAGSAPWNAPVGDMRIDVIRPNGAGFITEWTPVGAATNWDTNNDTNPDDDTTHVVATATNLSDLYEMEDVSTGNTIIAAQVLVGARRTDAGTANLATLLRHSGTTTQLTEQGLTSTYFYRNRDTFVAMPNADPLTDANINALQAGFKRTA